MRLILTHEQADFDALASLLGAYLLDETAFPVLPHRMNRNVKAFITLYGVDLPFVDQRDLPVEAVESICLVDTQVMATLRGTGPETEIYVVDHHSPRSNLPGNWTVTTEKVGATVTLLVERLQDIGLSISMIEATLLLLGIYEDTGSLTYTRTTSRDLLAAAFLLEQGANLGLASDFLNHPLSSTQQQVYDRLRKSIEDLDLHGYHILIATCDASDVDEELSTVVHKLRDLLDPDAIFVIASTRSGVQMICRSTTDHINVSEVASFFGGGGHSRAAASLIKGKSLQEVKDDLFLILPRYVHPATTVSEIMSRDPQVLTPATLVQEAAVRMQRYGYEGYPIVDDGKVIGLLTRRAVDRALSHKLNLKASSVMNAGCVTVHPDDSIEHLQRVMTDTGWGQIPVIRKDDQVIVGIVTRTDLLKTLTNNMVQPSSESMVERLENALPPARLALLKVVSEIAYEQHIALYVVGGFVRDLLLDRPSLDFDLVVEGDALTLAHSLGRLYGGRITSHSRFGTAKWLIKAIRTDLAVELGYKDAESDLPEFLDLISARTEFYEQPTALPTVESGNIKLDLHRRDFTINTMALRLDGNHYGELYDYWGGLADLRNKVLRVLHSLSFVDDPTRMLRAVRFEQRFGFQLEKRTLELLGEAVTLLNRVSGVRIRHEIDHILDEQKWLLMFGRLQELGLFQEIHAGFRWNETIQQRMKRLDDIDVNLVETLYPGIDFPIVRKKLIYILWMFCLPDEQVRAILSRINYPPNQIDIVISACKLHRKLPSLVDKQPSEIVSVFDNFPTLAIVGNYLGEEDDEQRAIILKYLTKWCHTTSRVTGETLLSMGLPPGPIYSTILNRLRAAWLDEEISTTQDERKLLNQLLSSMGD